MQPRRPRFPASGDCSAARRPLREDLIAQAGLEALALIRQDHWLADRALEFTLKRKRTLHSSERRAVADRVYDLLRRQITVDWLLARVRPHFESLSGSEKDLLRFAGCRVLSGERAELVAAETRLVSPDAAALRMIPAAARDLSTLEPPARLSIGGSIPPFLAEKFLADLGDEAEVAVAAMNQRAPLTVRANTLRTTRAGLLDRLVGEGVWCRPTSLSPLGLALETRINAFSLASFKEGWFEIQDEGSQLLGMLVDAPPTVVVDACAGAGGKSLQISAQMKNRGELHAFDIDEARMADLKRRARRAGAHNIRTRLIPPVGATASAAIADLQRKADRVLVDAPCSGTGTFRRKPDARYRLSSADLETHIRRQTQLLRQFSELVKPGGALIYGTCSILRDENEAVVEAFLQENSRFSIQPAASHLAPAVQTSITRGPFMRVFPHQHGTDGFFGAVLRGS